MRLQKLKNLPSNYNGSPRILSLNIRSLAKGIDKLREDSVIFQEKCDIICLCETNFKIECLPNGVDDLNLEGFHKPIFRDPHRKSGKGGGLIIYINQDFCANDEFSEIEFKHEADFLANGNDSNPSGEFLFVKIEIKLRSDVRKKLFIGNVYQSPSSNYSKFIDRLDL